MLTTLQITIIAIGVIVCVAICAVPTYMSRLHELRNNEYRDKYEYEQAKLRELNTQFFNHLNAYETTLGKIEEEVKSNTDIVTSLAQDVIDKLNK